MTGTKYEDDLHHAQLRKTRVHDLQALPVTKGRGGILQVAETDSAAYGFPREQQERNTMASLDDAFGISTILLHWMAEHMKAPVLQAVQATADNTLKLFQATRHHRKPRHAA